MNVWRRAATRSKQFDEDTFHFLTKHAPSPELSVFDVQCSPREYTHKQEISDLLFSIRNVQDNEVFADDFFTARTRHLRFEVEKARLKERKQRRNTKKTPTEFALRYFVSRADGGADLFRTLYTFIKPIFFAFSWTPPELSRFNLRFPDEQFEITLLIMAFPEDENSIASWQHHTSSKRGDQDINTKSWLPHVWKILDDAQTDLKDDAKKKENESIWTVKRVRVPALIDALLSTHGPASPITKWVFSVDAAADADAGSEGNTYTVEGGILTADLSPDDSAAPTAHQIFHHVEAAHTRFTARYQIVGRHRWCGQRVTHDRLHSFVSSVFGTDQGVRMTESDESARFTIVERVDSKLSDAQKRKMTPDGIVVTLAEFFEQLGILGEAISQLCPYSRPTDGSFNVLGSDGSFHAIGTVAGKRALHDMRVNARDDWVSLITSIPVTARTEGLQFQEAQDFWFVIGQLFYSDRFCVEVDALDLMIADVPGTPDGEISVAKTVSDNKAFTAKLKKILSRTVCATDLHRPTRGKRFTVIPVDLRWTGPRPAHANTMLVDTDNMSVRLFEPHGYSVAHQRVLDIVNKLLVDTATGYRVLEDTQICPQSGQGPQQSDDFCASWSLLYASMQMRSPDQAPENVAQELLEDIKKHPGLIQSFTRLGELMVPQPPLADEDILFEGDDDEWLEAVEKVDQVRLKTESQRQNRTLWE